MALLPFLAAASILDGAMGCQEIHPRETPASDGATYALAEGVQLVFGRDQSLDTESDYGQRAMLYTSEGGVLQRTYFSAGALDSSAMQPTFFVGCGPHELLILADIGNEYSWGLRVFAFDGKQLRDLGRIPIAVKGELDLESRIPFMKLTSHEQAIDLTFTTDVVQGPWGAVAAATRRQRRSLCNRDDVDTLKVRAGARRAASDPLLWR